MVPPWLFLVGTVAAMAFNFWLYCGERGERFLDRITGGRL